MIGQDDRFPTALDILAKASVSGPDVTFRNIPYEISYDEDTLSVFEDFILVKPSDEDLKKSWSRMPSPEPPKKSNPVKVFSFSNLKK